MTFDEEFLDTSGYISYELIGQIFVAVEEAYNLGLSGGLGKDRQQLNDIVLGIKENVEKHIAFNWD